MKFKKGDRVHVYGTVTIGSWDEQYRAVCHWLDRGDTAVVIDFSCGELYVRFTSSKAIKSRSLLGKEISVHPKQCRKLKNQKRK